MNTYTLILLILVVTKKYKLCNILVYIVSNWTLFMIFSRRLIFIFFYNFNNLFNLIKDKIDKLM